MLETNKGVYSPLSSAEPVRPVSHVSDTFITTPKDSYLLACNVRAREEEKKNHTQRLEAV